MAVLSKTPINEVQNVWRIVGTGDPAAGAGTPSGKGSVYHRTDGASGTTIYAKHGAADTDWSAL